LKFSFKISVIFALLFIGLCSPGFSQSDPNKIAKIKLKGIYIYSFAKNVYWPQDYSKGDFIIGVYGNKDIYDQLNNAYTNKPIGSQKITVKYYTELSDLKDCHLFFVSEEKTGNLSRVQKVLSSHTLLVSEGENLVTTGSMINFIYVQSRLKFQVNKTKAEKNDLKIGQTLQKLAHSTI
jgi:hypothetical protein